MDSLNNNARQSMPIEIGDEFILRRSSLEDLNQLVEFNRWIHYFVPDHEQTIPAMTQDLINRRCPNVDESDFTLIVEKSSGKIVSAMAMISQIWTFAGLPFQVGRPELVGTAPEYRGKGLIREQFNYFHRRCQERGQLVQAITGIPQFYRQFGYELAVPSGGGRMCFTPQQLPTMETGYEEIFNIRPATESDLQWISLAYQAGDSKYLLTCARDPETWQYELLGKNPLHIHKKEIWAITTRSNDPAGFFICDKPFGKVSGKFACWYELHPDFFWGDVTPSVLRFLWERGQQNARTQGGNCGKIGLELGEKHPAYQSVSHWLTYSMEPGAWYIRVANIPEFINLILPVLQNRLSASNLAGYDGGLRISLYNQCFRLMIHQGQMEQAAIYKPKGWEDADAAFPNLSFLQILFGHRSLSDLQYSYADCWCNSAKAELVQTLFPKLSSNIWGLA